MRKIILLLMIRLFVLVGCKKHKPAQQVVQELKVENVISTDKEYMFTNYGGDYRWFESCILLKDYLDEECNGTIAGISNVFQVISDNDGKSADTFVVLAAHTPDTTTYEVKHGFWVEDFPLYNEDIKLTFLQAYEKINRVNLPKPHSKNCVLRKPIGPLPCNPQYVFGNIQAQLWVDAVTGEVKESNPAFPEDIKLQSVTW